MTSQELLLECFAPKWIAGPVAIKLSPTAEGVILTFIDGVESETFPISLSSKSRRELFDGFNALADVSGVQRTMVIDIVGVVILIVTPVEAMKIVSREAKLAKVKLFLLQSNGDYRLFQRYLQ